jgi:tetratricopeptide (TPR) repeat protein
MRLDNIDLYAPCRCGSGKKYKFCCLRSDQQEMESGTEIKWDNPLRVAKASGRSIVVLDLEEGERLNEEGMRWLGRQQFAKAEKSFRAAIAAAPLIPAPHNNLALVAFAQGRIDEAIQIQESILSKVQGVNLFGMSNLVQFYLTAGRVTKAEALADATLHRKAHDSYALTKQCEAFARLGRHRDILKVVEQYVGESQETVHYFAGMAAANLGQFDRALDHLQRIGRRDLFGSRAAKYASLIKDGHGPDTIEGNWPYFEPQDIMPRAMFEKLIREADNNGPVDARPMNNPVFVDMLAAVINKSGGTNKDVNLVELLECLSHPRADELLKRIAEGTFGSDDFRLSALRTLVSKGVWDSESPRKIWARGKWTEVKSQHSAITTEAESAPMPEGLYPLYEAATIALRRGRWKEGEKMWREFIAQAPTFHPAYHNLAVALIQQGRKGEAETHLRKALELDPNYIFAPCTLAMLYIQEDRIAEARMLLDKMIVPDKIHPNAMATYCSAQVRLSEAEKDMRKATGWLDMAIKIAPDNPNVKALRKRLKIPLQVEKTFEKIRGKVEQEKLQRRRRVLSQDAPLADCYGVYSSGELAGMARAIGIDLDPSQRTDVLSAVCAALGNSETVRAIQRGLRPEETAALQEVADAGGRMDYETFTRAHDTDSDDEPGWSKQPQSILGRLKCRGLLVEATVERRPSVFIPTRISLPKV